MQYRFYTTSEKAWTAMLDAIRSAKKSVYLESFIFLHDTFPTHNFVAVLKEKAREGVRVRLVIDAFGSYYFDQEEQRALESAGAELLFFKDWFRRIHRKVLIIDEKSAFLGGVNIGKKYIHWLDLHMLITSPGLIKSLLRSFAHIYRLSGGTDHTVLSYEKRPSIRARAEMWLVEHWPKTEGKEKMRIYYEERLSKATKSVRIVSPYFLPHRWFLRSIRSALKRGVRVEVFLPEKTSPEFVTIPNLFFAAALYEEGVHFYFSKMMNHAKVLLVDDTEALVGSQNIDAQSFDFNAEIGVSFRKPEMVEDLRNIIEQWREGAIEFTHDYFRKRWYHAPLEFLARLFQPVL